MLGGGGGLGPVLRARDTLRDCLPGVFDGLTLALQPLGGDRGQGSGNGKGELLSHQLSLFVRLFVVRVCVLVCACLCVLVCVWLFLCALAR